MWEPFGAQGQEGVSHGRLAMDGDDVWFIADQDRATSPGTLFLTKTTPSGDTLVPATNVDGPGPQYLGRSSLTVTNAGVVIGFERADPLPDQGDHPYVRAFDHDGVAMTATPQRVPVVVGGMVVDNMYALALAPAADGHARMMTSFTTTNEVALVDLDATGTATGTTVAAGTPDGDLVGTLATATLADDSTLIAWDRVYDACAGDTRPARTLTAVVDPAWNLSAPVALGDQPDRQDTSPAVASRGGATYMAWSSFTAGAATTWLAPYAAADAAISIGPAWGPPAIALADAAHGALVWVSSDSMLNVQAFENTGAGLAARELRTLPPVGSDPEIAVSLAGAASLGDTRYLLAWEEQWLDNSAPTRLYATVVDLADPAPAMAHRGTPRVLTRPCD